MRIFKLIWYFFFWTYVRLGLSYYYRRIKLSGIEHIPKGVPVIFGSNHENALIDPLLKTTRFPLMIHYLVRADVFNNSAIRWFLNSLNLMPVYRMSDGVNTVKANEQIFRNCFEVFKKGEHLILYPEGTHESRRIPRPAKKGIARIALGAMNEPDAPEELYIVPFGMNYSAHRKFRSAVHIKFGEAIRVDKVPDTPENIEKLRDQYEAAVSKCHVSLPKKRFEVLDKIFFHDQEPRIVLEPEDINEKAWRLDQLLTDEQAEEVLGFAKKMEKVGIKFPFHFRQNYWFTIFLIFVLLPFALLGIALHFPLIMLGRFIMRGIKDKVFTDTMFFGVGLVLAPFTWIILGITVSKYSENPWIGMLSVFFAGTCLITARIVVRLWEAFRNNRKLRKARLLQEYKSFVSIINIIRQA
ncbi:MAG: 1-acyl-sn-glycerol-3-phosphate acyltransferase [Bacteroidota bacterium]